MMTLPSGLMSRKLRFLVIVNTAGRLNIPAEYSGLTLRLYRNKLTHDPANEVVTGGQ